VRVPEVVIRNGATPIIRSVGSTTSEVLKEVCLNGVVGEEVVAQIRVCGGGGGSSSGGGTTTIPLVVKVSVHYPNSGPAIFKVSPDYLSLDKPTTLTISFMAHRAGEHSGYLLLEYTGCQAHIWLRGKAEEHLSFDASGEHIGGGGCSSGSSDNDPMPPTPEQPNSLSLLSWGVLCVGCSAVREISLRNHQAVAVFVRCSVDDGGSSSSAFTVDGGGRIGPGGLLRLVLTFKPQQPGHWIASLDICATPDGDGYEGAMDRTRQGALEYLATFSGKEPKRESHGAWQNMVVSQTN